ncbi:hypothetical protein SSS_04573 [Sarcoptes scabiei]|nr:hypothetical protein SSS_04573 [Sarcoptes scabiei]
MASFNASSCYDQAVANMMSSNYGGLLSAAFADPMRSLFGVRNLPTNPNNSNGSNTSSNNTSASRNNNSGSSDHQSSLSISMLREKAIILITWPQHSIDP